MGKQQELFKGINKHSKTVKPDKALFVTNTDNFRYTLAAGLFMSPKGYRSSYFEDTLNAFPGWIPLFLNSPSKAVVEKVIQEAKHLKPVIIEINLSKLSGEVKVIASDELTVCELQTGIPQKAEIILLPAPLPISMINVVYFKSSADKKTFMDDANDFINVSLDGLELRIKRQFFNRSAKSDTWPPIVGSPLEREVPLNQPLAVGGVLAMLSRFANVGNQVVRACQIAFDDDQENSPDLSHDLLLSSIHSLTREGKIELPSMAQTTMNYEDDSIHQLRTQLFLDGVNSIVAKRGLQSDMSVEELLIEYLGSISESITNPSFAAEVRELQKTLMSLADASEVNVAKELIEKHVSAMERAMLLMFLCDDCRELVDYYFGQLTETDLMFAAIMFGAREGWLDMPYEHRRGHILSNAVSYRMARLSHRIAGSQLTFGDTPPRSEAFREILGDPSNWKKHHKAIASEIAHIQGWQDCIYSKIKLGTGEYKLITKGGQVSIIAPGEIKIDLEINGEHFLNLLSASLLSYEVEKKIRESQKL